MLRIHGYVYSGMLQNAREYGTYKPRYPHAERQIHARKCGITVIYSPLCGILDDILLEANKPYMQHIPHSKSSHTVISGGLTQEGSYPSVFYINDRIMGGTKNVSECQDI